MTPPTFGHCPFGGGLNACPDGLGHLFREELSKFYWAYPCFWGGSKRLPRLFVALTVFGSIQPCRMVKMARKKVPQSARLRAGGGSNRYLGNAQMEGASNEMGLPLSNFGSFLDQMYLCYFFYFLHLWIRAPPQPFCWQPCTIFTIHG